MEVSLQEGQGLGICHICFHFSRYGGTQALFPIPSLDFALMSAGVVTNFSAGKTKMARVSVLSGVLDHSGKSHHVTLTDTTLSWCPTGAQECPIRNVTLRQTVQLEDVIGIGPCKKDNKITQEGDIELQTCGSVAFSFHVVKKMRKHKWRDKGFVFQCQDVITCQNWIQKTQDALEAINSHRPKRLLVFINPVGGKRRGCKIYTEKVEPLFQLANIKTDVIVTRRANHARDHLLKVGLEKVDGVVSVGGDGMFNEILNGLVLRSQADERVDTSATDVEPVAPGTTIGIIPAGSTDTVAYCTTGNNDPVTSALHIILGAIQPLDVCSIKHQSEVLKYSVSMAAYGFFGDVMQDSERLRWMGPKRYDCSGFKKFMLNRGYEGEVDFLPAGDGDSHPRDDNRCRTGCCVCFGETVSGLQTPKSSNAAGSSWQKVRGRFISVIGANISCACSKTPEGLSPSAHLADGCLDLILVWHTSRLQYLRHMMRLTNKADQFSFNFVEVHRVKEFRFRPATCDDDQANDSYTDAGDPSSECGDQAVLAQSTKNTAASPRTPSAATSLWNVDGELVQQAAISVRVHRQLVKLYAHGIEECEDTPSCTVCRRR